jgi:hypothetical protein
MVGSRAGARGIPKDLVKQPELPRSGPKTPKPDPR